MEYTSTGCLQLGNLPGRLLSWLGIGRVSLRHGLGCYRQGVAVEHTSSSEITAGPVIELTSFFDLLARFDFEDKQREESVFNVDSSVSAPGGSALGPDYKKPKDHGAEKSKEK